MFAIKYLIVIFCLREACSQAQQSLTSVGDPCTIKSTGADGTCMVFKDCKKAHENLQQRIFPQICEVQGSQSIVCCENDFKKQGLGRKPGEISEAKCREYAQYVYEKVRSPVLLIKAPVTEKYECGHSVVKLIIGGDPAGRKEFPHMAAIGYETYSDEGIVWHCAGSIISENYVLTAGHCLKTRYGPATYVKVGITNLNDNSKYKQEFNISETIQFPLYNSSSRYHDVALIKLNKPVKMNSYARPACLNFHEEISTELAIATGWGYTDNETEISNNLKKVTLKLFSQEDCGSYKNIKTRKLSDGIVNDIQVCAGSRDINKREDTCHGDSGGPLQIYHIGDDIKCMYDIIGVTSFGMSCAGMGIYSRISHYIKWIEDIVWP